MFVTNKGTLVVVLNISSSQDKCLQSISGHDITLIMELNTKSVRSQIDRRNRNELIRSSYYF